MKAYYRLLISASLLAFPIVLLPSIIRAQVAEETSPTIPVLHIGTQLVIVDVTVKDREGRPVHGLKREDFRLTESKQPRTISHFEEHTGQMQQAAGSRLPPMPPGTFTDYTPVPPESTLNILLLDTLNTPVADQSYVRSQLKEFVKKAKPGTRIAIFGLSTRLFLLQGFSSDPQILKDAVEHKAVPRSSYLLNDPAGPSTESASDIASALPNQDATGANTGVASALSQFEANEQAFQTQLRIQYTLDAFNTLAHYLSAFQGRKNLIWFSGSFPINILPDPTLSNPFSVMENNNSEFRETTNLLSRAQVAVYPVDARGLMADTTFAASTSGRSMTTNSTLFASTSNRFFQSQADEHMTMSQLAEDTGGAAFYNTNDLASAVENAIAAGSNYYTLMYTPSNQKQNSDYREIRVTLNGNLQADGYTLSYRRGYYSQEPNQHAATAVTTTANLASTNSGEIYARVAMAHGAPMPEDILFKVRVLPVGTATEETLAQDNQANPAHLIKPPFRRFAIDIAAVGDDFHLTQGQDGRHVGAIEFSALLYDNDGQILNVADKAVELNLTPDAYRSFLSGVTTHLEISVPVKGNADFLRIGVRNITANLFGVVEVPVASVARLTPLPASIKDGGQSHN
jgi:VWFA-related protein